MALINWNEPVEYDWGSNEEAALDVAAEILRNTTEFEKQWQGKIVRKNKKIDRIEIRNNLYQGQALLMFVPNGYRFGFNSSWGFIAPDGKDGFFLSMSSNGKMFMTPEQFPEFNLVVQEGSAVARKLFKVTEEA